VRSSDVTHDPDPDRELSSVRVSTTVFGSIDIRIYALGLYPLSDAIMLPAHRSGATRKGDD